MLKVKGGGLRGEEGCGALAWKTCEIEDSADRRKSQPGRSRPPTMSLKGATARDE